MSSRCYPPLDPATLLSEAYGFQEAYWSIMESIEDSLPEVDELLSNPCGPDEKPRYCHARNVSGKLKKWIYELQGVQSKLVEVLDWDLVETVNEDERAEKEEVLWETIHSRREYLQGLESQLGNLEELMVVMQEELDEEKDRANEDRAKSNSGSLDSSTDSQEDGDDSRMDGDDSP